MTVPQITAEVTGVGQAIQRLKAIPPERMERVARVVRRSGIALSNRVKSQKLTGQVLNVRTGRLRRSINERFERTDTSAVSTVGTNLPYGAFWERGFVGVQTVRAHVRRVKARDRFRGRRSAKNQIAAGIAAVRMHQRRVAEPARPFLQPALDEVRPQVLADITAAVKGA